MAVGNRKKIDQAIEEAKAKQARAIARQAKSFLDVVINWTEDKYVDARLLEEFLDTPVMEVISPVIRSYAEYAKPNVKYTDDDDGSPLIALNQETFEDISKYVDAYNPVSPDEKRDTDDVLCIGEYLAMLWPDIRRKLDAEEAKKRRIANKKRQATRLANQRSGDSDAE